MRSIGEGMIPFEKEVLTPAQQINELIMISLRTQEGLNLQRITQDIQGMDKGELVKVKDQLLKESRKYIRNGLMTQQEEWLRLTREGKLLADGIAAGLFL